MADALRCSQCGQHTCRQPAESAKYPDHCPMSDQRWAAALHSARLAYDEPPTRAIAAAASRTEAAGYCRDTRIEEVMRFARRLGVEHIGIAHCIGLFREAGLTRDIMERAGFQVSTVCCKLRAIPKEEMGLTDAEKIRPGQHENICNPVGQARLLDAAGCGLNVLMGLCVGHDTLFMRSSGAPVTVLVVKDRVLGHNPVAALYLSRSYYRHLRGEGGKYGQETGS